MAKDSFKHAKIVGKTFSISKIFAWSQSISPQIFGNYKGEKEGRRRGWIEGRIEREKDRWVDG